MHKPISRVPVYGLNISVDVAFETSRRILIVDSSRLIRSVFSQTLSQNYECIAVSCYEEAIAQLKLAEVDVVLADVHIPGRSGFELLTRIVKSCWQTEVILTSRDQPEFAAEALRLGAFAYLIKPCELSSLQLTVLRAADTRQRRVEAVRDREDRKAPTMVSEQGWLS